MYIWNKLMPLNVLVSPNNRNLKLETVQNQGEERVQLAAGASCRPGESRLIPPI